jgi:membrane fusion protein (multidrug efflux system)
VQQEGDRSYVFRVVADGKGGGDKVEEVPVVLGTRQAGKVEIRSGLRAGDRIVVDGTVKLRPGSRIVEAGATP